MRKVIFLLVLVHLVSFSLMAQELKCTVKVNSQQIQGSDKRVYETLQTAVFEFLNNTKWTKDVYTNDERIECSFLINITERPSTDQFSATLQVQFSRPVYKSSYNSVLLNYRDKDFQFKYLEYQSLEFSENQNLSNLTSVLAYYAYLAIGMDYDSFAPEGGTVYLQKAQTIVNNAQNANETGWKAFESNKNRYWLVFNMLDQVFSPLRECTYKYHRLGLDIMNNDKDGGRATIAESLSLIQKTNADRPNSFNMKLFFDSKADELVNIFSQGSSAEKTKVVNILNEVDGANSSKYQKILSSN